MSHTYQMCGKYVIMYNSCHMYHKYHLYYVYQSPRTTAFADLCFAEEKSIMCIRCIIWYTCIIFIIPAWCTTFIICILCLTRIRCIICIRCTMCIMYIIRITCVICTIGSMCIICIKSIICIRRVRRCSERFGRVRKGSTVECILRKLYGKLNAPRIWFPVLFPAELIKSIKSTAVAILAQGLYCEVDSLCYRHVCRCAIH